MLARCMLVFPQETVGNQKNGGAPAGPALHGLAWPKNGVHYLQAIMTPKGDFASELTNNRRADGGVGSLAVPECVAANAALAPC
jgi:hypothetical protein